MYYLFKIIVTNAPIIALALYHYREISFSPNSQPKTTKKIKKNEMS